MWTNSPWRSESFRARYRSFRAFAGLWRWDLLCHLARWGSHPILSPVRGCQGVALPRDRDARACLQDAERSFIGREGRTVGLGWYAAA
jgi:hypothetical protein